MFNTQYSIFHFSTLLGIAAFLSCHTFFQFCPECYFREELKSKLFKYSTFTVIHATDMNYGFFVIKYFSY